MAEQMIDQIRRYWVIIATVAAVAFGLGGSQALTLSKIAGLEATVHDFVAEGPRHSLKDHLAYADRQSDIDRKQDEMIAEQNRQISILFERMNRNTTP